MSLAGLIHRITFAGNEHKSTLLWRKRTDSMVAIVTGPSFPYWLCLFHSWKWTVMVKLRLWILHTLPLCLGFLLAVTSESSPAWKAFEGREELLRRIWILREHFTWPQPGPQHGGQCQFCSQICCLVQNSLTKVKQINQWGLVGFLCLERKEVSITRYFLAASSETLVCYALATARDKQLMRKRNKYGELCTGGGF